jgi:CBS domain containing-hemolysin-like protein
VKRLIDGLLCGDDEGPLMADYVEMPIMCMMRPLYPRGRYHTLNGMIMWLLGRLPQTTDRVVWEQWQLEVVELDGNGIDKVLATRQQEKRSMDDAGVHQSQ